MAITTSSLSHTLDTIDCNGMLGYANREMKSGGSLSTKQLPCTFAANKSAKIGQTPVLRYSQSPTRVPAPPVLSTTEQWTLLTFVVSKVFLAIITHYSL
ncbi:hypothetical protein PCASD_08763 [Puccinia coronata f. sp. avenae]|uniref:Uncharacterized protein n=1 Tax=Puccinia coronata f. sp. avenae TaxID=200324 RepID=A0A2N5T9P8_9BASI|nr:hypothetical protein PCASD_17232 [Puccinia coronata f. sp. avenae]PLW39599.1 hypothetical protein PCASD_08763 [Puccinia coronata f. sp. avenae]